MPTEALQAEPDTSWGEVAPVSSAGDVEVSGHIDGARDLSLTPAARVQLAWSHTCISMRLKVLRRARHILADLAPEITAAVSSDLSRTPADTLVSELLPLLAAIRFLERDAPRLLRLRRPGRSGRPLWLPGVRTEVQRVPLGRILVIGPSNYPLFLPGVQVFQALAAGNSVTWKPGVGGSGVAAIVAGALDRAGLPAGLLIVTEDSVEAAQRTIRSGVDKVFFTGSGASGRALLRQLADTATPCVLELSGNDAVVVLACADLDVVVAALAFGMRLNGSATCMAPRRVLLVDTSADRRSLFLQKLVPALAEVPAVTLSARVRRQLISLVSAAERGGATVIGDPSADRLKPVLLLDGDATMEIAQADIFAPVLTLIDVKGADGVVDAQAACPLALTTSIFGDEPEARSLAAHIPTGTVTINDLIVSTADPRIPFGGRGQSGFGVTRGAEGLLEMTAVKVLASRRSGSKRQYEPTGDAHTELFEGMIHAAHSHRFRQRWSGLKQMMKAAMELKKK